MSKIRYHKEAQKHPAAQKVKRLYTKLVKDFEEDVYQFSCYPKIRGIEKEDASYIKFLIGDQYNSLVKNIEAMRKRVDAREDGYYSQPYLKRMQLIVAMEGILSYIQKEYIMHEQEFKHEHTFIRSDVKGRRFEIGRLFDEKGYPLKDKYCEECNLIFETPVRMMFATDEQIMSATKVEITYK